MGNTKWADVAHYYLQSPITLVDDIGDIYDCSIAASLGYLYRWKPILRHRDDITEAEAWEICEPMIESLKETEGDSFEPPKSYKKFLLRPFTHKGTWSLLDHAIGNPRDWHKFIKWGIDVFRLIESGQAIRKEAGNG